MSGPVAIDSWQVVRDVMHKVDRQIFGRLGYCVQTGPFAGMEITDHPNWDDGNATLKLLGLYEHELWGSIELAIERKPRAVINIGCAEGYYAIGLKRRLSQTPVFAVDVNGQTLEQCSMMAERNGVSVITRIGCRVPEDLLFGYLGSLYVVDCEGAELDLLDPIRCVELQSADIIVECHDWATPISLPLAQRFSRTHEVKIIEPELADLRPYQKLLDPLPMGTKLLALTEKRPMPTVWLSLMAKQKGHRHG